MALVRLGTEQRGRQAVLLLRVASGATADIGCGLDLNIRFSSLGITEKPPEYVHICARPSFNTLGVTGFEPVDLGV